MSPTPPNNLPKVENLPKKVAVATVLVLVGHGLAFWGLSKVKTPEIKPIQTPPIQIKFLKIAEPPVEEKPPVVTPPPPAKPKPIEKKPEPTPPKPAPKPPVEKPKPPVDKPKPPVEKPKLIEPKPLLTTKIDNSKQLEAERLERERQKQDELDRKRREQDELDRKRREQDELDRKRREQDELDRKRREQDELDRKRREQDELDRKRREQEELDRKRREQEELDRKRNTPQSISEGEIAWKNGRPTISTRILEMNLDKGESVYIVVGFAAQANGKISNAWLIQGSGKKNLDDAAIRSVKSSALKPYPHPVEAKTSFKLTLK